MYIYQEIYIYNITHPIFVSLFEIKCFPQLSENKNIYYSLSDSFNLEKYKSTGHQFSFTRLSLGYGAPTEKKVLPELLSEILGRFYPSHLHIIYLRLYSAHPQPWPSFCGGHVSSIISLAHEGGNAASRLPSPPRHSQLCLGSTVSSNAWASLCWGRPSSGLAAVQPLV